MSVNNLLEDPPKSLWLWSENDDHAGWMFLAPQAKGIKACHGQCVFMLTSVSKEGIDSKLGIVVADLKVLGEHDWKMVPSKSGVVLSVTPDGLPEVRIEFDNEVSGKIYTEFDNAVICLGSAERKVKQS